MDTKEYITIVIAVLGAVLGLVNFIRAIFRDKIHVKVIPTLYWRMRADSESENGLGVEVINLGFMPVTIQNAYFETENKGILADMGITVLDGTRNLPVRLDPRESVTLCFNPDIEFDQKGPKPTGVLVKTACGLKLRSRNKVFKKWIIEKLK